MQSQALMACVGRLLIFREKTNRSRFVMTTCFSFVVFRSKRGLMRPRLVSDIK